MKFTLGWLRQHLESDVDAAAVAERLTALGIEIETVADRARDLAPFTVGYVVEAKPHPNADRLRVCIVDTGKEKVQVVCGAPNARTGMKGVFAPAGSRIPGTGLELRKGVIRGVESNGMLCSAREMGLGEDHDGIIDLPADAPVGKPFAALMGLDDPVFDAKVTPDRADCLGVRGIARDLAAAGVGTLKPFDLSPVKGSFESPIRWRRDLADEAACPYVVGRYFRGLRNGPSPQWLRDRLVAIGLRPISALVDITNFVTFDLNRPLHVFDAKKLAGDLVMRMAKPDETILALDGRRYALDPDMTVIADARAVHGIGGIMGGEASGCSEATTEMFLEVALFDPKRTATTGRRLGIESDARYRFERGLDPASADWGAEVAARLVLELCGGEASEVVRAGSLPEWRRHVALRPDRIRDLGGLDVPAARASEILTKLGFEVTAKDGRLETVPPSWRADIAGEPDLVEEVLRVEGFDKVPAVPLDRASALPEPAVTPAQRRGQQAKRLLADRGLLEAVTYSFTASAAAGHFGGVKPELRLANPISADLDVMRPSILPNLLMAAARNQARGIPDIGLFEVGPHYSDVTEKGQALVAAGIRIGQDGPRHWRDGHRPVDAFVAKADAQSLLTALGAPVENFQTTADAPGWYHPGQSGQFRLGPTLLARFGALHPRVAQAFDIEGPAVAFEVMLEAVPQPRAGKGRAAFRPSTLQPVERDFAFLVDAAVPAEKLLRAAKGADKALIASVGLFDLYEGERLGAGKKSVAISVVLQPTERTLTDAEIEAVSQKIVAAVAKATGAVLRS